MLDLNRYMISSPHEFTIFSYEFLFLFISISQLKNKTNFLMAQKVFFLSLLSIWKNQNKYYVKLVENIHENNSWKHFVSWSIVMWLGLDNIISIKLYVKKFLSGAIDWFKYSYDKIKYYLEILFSFINFFSTTTWVAIPAWSHPGFHRHILPDIRCHRVTASSTAFVRAWPKW